jgi:hypothetical protein
MLKVNLELAGFGIMPVQRKMIALRALIEAMVCVNWQFLLEHHGMPEMLDMHKHKPFKLVEGTEAWRDIPALIATGEGGVKDFVAWRIAELRNSGHDDVYPSIRYQQMESDVRMSPPPRMLLPTVAAPPPMKMTVYKMGVRIGDKIEDIETLFGKKDN